MNRARRRLPPWWAAALLAAVALPAPGRALPPEPPWGIFRPTERDAEELWKKSDRLPYEDLVYKLRRVKGASVSSACGATVAPWAYRGSRGTHQTLRPYVTDEHDKRWARGFVEALLRPGDWGTDPGCSGEGKRCDREHDEPLFVVTLHLNVGDVYVLFHFDRDCAVLFERDRPLGTLRLGSRSDSLFALIRSALPDDPRVALMTRPPGPDTSAAHMAAVPDSVTLDSLPEAISRVSPEYPPEAIRRNVEGVAVIQALVDVDGTVADAFVVESPPLLRDPALDALWQFRFRPAIASGQPVPVWVRVPVTFRLR